MRTKRAVLVAVCALATGLLLSSANDIKAESKIVIKPKIQAGVQYNSNFWRAEEVEVGVNTYSLNPGIVVGVETPKTNVSLDATLNANWYEDQDTTPAGVRDSSDDDFVGVTAILGADHQLTQRLNVGVSDRLFVSRDPANSDVSSNSISREKYTVNYFEPNVFYEFGQKFSLDSRYRNTLTNYEDLTEDSLENRGIFDLYYNLNRNAAIYVDYQIWQRDYDGLTSDYLSNLISINYRQVFNFMVIDMGGGYHNRSFDEDGLDSLDLFSWNIKVNGGGEEKSKSSFSVNLGQNMNDSGTDNQYFTATFIEVSGAYRFFNKLELSVFGSYQNSDYEFEDRSDDTIFGSAKIAYDIIEYITVGLEGGLESRDSDIDGNSYDDAYVLFTLDVNYNFGSR